jgi:hypothetical protein
MINARHRRGQCTRRPISVHSYVVRQLMSTGTHDFAFDLYFWMPSLVVGFQEGSTMKIYCHPSIRLLFAVILDQDLR